MFNLKKTYTIKFEKVKRFDTSPMGLVLGGYFSARNSEIILRVKTFCLKNNIELKKIHICEDDCYIKIKGKHNDCEQLIDFLTQCLGKVINITDLKW